MTEQKQKTRITADLKKNRLMITLGGRIRKPELERIYTDIRFCVQDLQPGFNVITDLRDCTIGYLSGALVFKKIMEYFLANKVGKIVRIVGNSRTIVHQISKLTSTMAGYSPIHVNTPEEAEEALAEEEKVDLSV